MRIRYRAVLMMTVAAAGRLSAQRQASTLVSADWDLVMAVGRANLFESNAATLAKSKSSSAAIKAYADEIQTDHGKLDSDLKTAAKHADPDLKYPDQMDGPRSKRLDELEHAVGFDAAFKQQMIATHAAAVQMIHAYLTKAGTNAEIKAVAVAALPVFQRHLDHARALP